MKLCLRSLALMVVVGMAPLRAQAPAPLDPAPEIGTAPTMEDRYPERRIRFANGTVGLPDQAYAQYNGFRPQTLDVYLPPETMAVPPGGFPLVLHIHGGGWSGGDARKAAAIKDLPSVFAQLAAKGYIVASLNYRLSAEAPFPAAEKDVKVAIRWLRSHAAAWRMDPARAAVWGGSAGGHLAGLAAVSCNAPALDPLAPTTGERPAAAAEPGRRPPPGAAPNGGRDGPPPGPPRNPMAALATISDCVQAGVTWYGVFDFATIDAQAGHPAVPKPFLGCAQGDCTAAIREASPVTYIDRADPPMLLIAGTEDHTVPHAQSVEMEAKLKAVGVPVTLISLPGIDHSFIGKTPDATREATLKALAATFDFFDRTIGPRRPR